MTDSTSSSEPKQNQSDSVEFLTAIIEAYKTSDVAFFQRMACECRKQPELHEFAEKFASAANRVKGVQA